MDMSRGVAGGGVLAIDDETTDIGGGGGGRGILTQVCRARLTIFFYAHLESSVQCQQRHVTCFLS